MTIVERQLIVTSCVQNDKTYIFYFKGIAKDTAPKSPSQPDSN